MRGLVRAEFRKTFATSAWWWLAVLGMVIAALQELTAVREEYVAFSMSRSLDWAYLSALLFGIYLATTEYRRNTIVGSYLGVSGRSKLVVAKVLCAIVVGAGYAVLSAGVAVAAVPVVGIEYGDEWPWILLVSGAGLVLFALVAAVGVGLGTLIRNQLGAVLVAVFYLLLFAVAPSLLLLAKGWGRAVVYLPDAAATSFLRSMTGGDQFNGTFGVAPAWWTVLLVLCGYTVLFVLLGIVAARRRDIT